MNDLKNVFNNGRNIQNNLEFATNFYKMCKYVLSTINLAKDKKIKMLTLSVYSRIKWMLGF